MANLIAVTGNFRFSGPPVWPSSFLGARRCYPILDRGDHQRLTAILLMVGCAVFGVAMFRTAISCAGAAPLCRGCFVINRLVRLIVKRKGMEVSVSSDITRPSRCPA